MTKLEETLIKLGYERYLNKYFKWVNGYRITFELDEYDNKLIDYHIKPNEIDIETGIIKYNVFIILKQDLEVLKNVED